MGQLELKYYLFVILVSDSVQMRSSCQPDVFEVLDLAVVVFPDPFHLLSAVVANPLRLLVIVLSQLLLLLAPVRLYHIQGVLQTLGLGRKLVLAAAAEQAAAVTETNSDVTTFANRQPLVGGNLLMGKPIDEFSQQGNQKESGCRGDPVDEADVIEPLPVAHVQVDAVRGVAQYLDRTRSGY